MNHDDFGFTLIDDPVEVNTGLQQTIVAHQADREILLLRIEAIMNVINPFLDRLAADPDKPNIKWENRAAKIKEIKDKLNKILKGF